MIDYLRNRCISLSRVNEILDLDAFAFSGGPGCSPDGIVVDPVFAKSLSSVLKTWILDTIGDIELGSSLLGRTFRRPIDPVRHAGITYCEVEAPASGVVAFIQNSSSMIVGAYTGMDLAVNPGWQRKGIGRILVAERFLRDGSLPSWNCDKPGFSPAGKACHDSAFRGLCDYAEDRLRADRLSDTEKFKGERHWSPDRPVPQELAHLGVADVEITHGSGTVRLSQSEIELFVAGNGQALLEPLEFTTSLMSAEPAVIYRSQEAELPLTPDELGRLVSRTLLPHEFTAICDYCGSIWETSSSFYDPETGGACEQAGPDVGRLRALRVKSGEIIMSSNVEPISDYWRQGTRVIEECLAKAVAANPSDAPFPLVGEEAALWHSARAAAYQHALEMMGVPLDYQAEPASADDGPSL